MHARKCVRALFLFGVRWQRWHPRATDSDNLQRDDVHCMAVVLRMRHASNAVPEHPRFAAVLAINNVQAHLDGCNSAQQVAK